MSLLESQFEQILNQLPHELQEPLRVGLSNIDGNREKARDALAIVLIRFMRLLEGSKKDVLKSNNNLEGSAIFSRKPSFVIPSEVTRQLDSAIILASNWDVTVPDASQATKLWLAYQALLLSLDWYQNTGFNKKMSDGGEA